jgi:hypothetical protein
MSRRQAAALIIDTSGFVGDVPEPGSPRLTRHRGNVPPGPESSTMRRREAREQREAAAAAAVEAVEAAEAMEAAEARGGGDGHKVVRLLV